MQVDTGRLYWRDRRGHAGARDARVHPVAPVISRRGQGIHIFVGSESGLATLDECSVITAPYSVDGQVVGTLAVVGPKRMDYERIIPIVDITARLLGNALSQT